MAYRKPHLDCSESNCQTYSAYIRIQKKWVKAGEYNSKCRTFTPVEQVRTYDQIKEDELKNHIESIHTYEKCLDSKSRHIKWHY